MNMRPRFRLSEPTQEPKKEEPTIFGVPVRVSENMPYPVAIILVSRRDGMTFHGPKAAKSPRR